MMSQLAKCPACMRHVRPSSASCPFCDAALSLEARPAASLPRLSRAKMVALGAAVIGTTALGAVGCDDGPGSDDAGPPGVDAGLAQPYGAPPLVTDIELV